jgi:polyhydroxyalkanoate synthesis regulator phasin
MSKQLSNEEIIESHLFFLESTINFGLNPTINGIINLDDDQAPEQNKLSTLTTSKKQLLTSMHNATSQVIALTQDQKHRDFILLQTAHAEATLQGFSLPLDTSAETLKKYNITSAPKNFNQIGNGYKRAILELAGKDLPSAEYKRQAEELTYKYAYDKSTSIQNMRVVDPFINHGNINADYSDLVKELINAEQRPKIEQKVIKGTDNLINLFSTAQAAASYKISQQNLIGENKVAQTQSQPPLEPPPSITKEATHQPPPQPTAKQPVIQLNVEPQTKQIPVQPTASAKAQPYDSMSLWDKTKKILGFDANTTPTDRTNAGENNGIAGTTSPTANASKNQGKKATPVAINNLKEAAKAIGNKLKEQIQNKMQKSSTKLQQPQQQKPSNAVNTQNNNTAGAPYID